MPSVKVPSPSSPTAALDPVSSRYTPASLQSVVDQAGQAVAQAMDQANAAIAQAANAALLAANQAVVAAGQTTAATSSASPAPGNAASLDEATAQGATNTAASVAAMKEPAA